MTHTENHIYGFSKTKAWRITYASPEISVSELEPLGTADAPTVPDAAGIPGGRLGWQAVSVNKRRWLALAALLLTGLIALALSGCIPVTVRPQFDDKGLPIALPVTPTGSMSVDGVLTPIYEVSSEAPKPTNWGAVGLGISAILNAILMAYGINLRGFASKAMTALRISCQLADDNAAAETDEQVERNKKVAESLQIRNNVQAITQKARGKT